MTATYGALTSVAFGTRTNTTINVPASTGNGDLLVLLHVTANTGTAVSATLPAGFTSLGSAQTGTDGSFGWRALWGYRIASSEPASYTVTHASTGAEGLMIRVDGTGTLSVDVSSQNQTATLGVTTTANSVTTTASDDLLVFFGLNWNEVAFTPPTGMTERQDSSFIYLATQALVASGATGTRTQTHTNDPWFGNLIAIKDTAGGGSQSITGALFADSDSFFGATVAPGSVSVTGALFTDADTFFGATVSTTASIAGTLFSDGDTFFASTVSPGAVGISGALFTNSNGFFGSTVSASYSITGAIYTDADTFQAATVSASYAISGGLFSDGDTFFAATVAPGAVSISGALYTDADSFFASTVSQAGNPQSITGALFSNANSFFGATVSTTYSVSGALYSNADTFFGASVTPGAVSITGGLYLDADSFFGATVSQASNQTITGALYANDNRFFGASVQSGGATSSGRSVGTSYAYKTLTELREEEKQKLAALQKRAVKVVAKVISGPGILTMDLTEIVQDAVEATPQYKSLAPDMVDFIAAAIEAKFRKAFERRLEEEDDEEAMLLAA